MPNLPAWRYKELTDAFYKDRAILAAEQVAMIFGAILVPAPCFNHKRRRPERRVMILGRSYYVVSPEEMTEAEKTKYQLYVNDDSN